MKNIENLFVEIQVDNQKIDALLKSFIPDVKAGRLTIDEIKETIVDDLKEYVNIKVIIKEI